jgi:NTE family protein
MPEEPAEDRQPLVTEQDGGAPTSGRALCLSGGGYRAMLFHTGALWRLNEAGWLPTLDRVSSVSGGSITAGVLGLAWDELGFDARGVSPVFAEKVARPVRRLAAVRLDVAAVARGLLPRASIGERVAKGYRDHLFGDATLQALPDRPRFVLNATNVGTGSLVRFSKPYLADWRVGRILAPDVPLAVAVACSSAFPPVLSPYRLDLRGRDWVTDQGNVLTSPEYRDAWLLTDGGVYDNLGIETAWGRHRTVLVSDAGGQMGPEPRPDRDWPRHLLRVLKVVDNQVRSLRKRQVVRAFVTGDRDGAYLGIRSDITHYPVDDPLPAPRARTLALADLPTRLSPVDAVTQERLINWGYAVTDAALRAHVDRSLPRGELPLPSPV